MQEHDCKLTQEIIELIDREADLLMRGVRETNLDGLRKRISTLFLQYIKTPTFNPEAAKLLKVISFVQSDVSTTLLYWAGLSFCLLRSQTQFLIQFEEQETESFHLDLYVIICLYMKNEKNQVLKLKMLLMFSNLYRYQGSHMYTNNIMGFRLLEIQIPDNCYMILRKLEENKLQYSSEKMSGFLSVHRFPRIHQFCARTSTSVQAATVTCHPQNLLCLPTLVTLANVVGVQRLTMMLGSDRTTVITDIFSNNSGKQKNSLEMAPGLHFCYRLDLHTFSQWWYRSKPRNNQTATFPELIKTW